MGPSAGHHKQQQGLARTFGPGLVVRSAPKVLPAQFHCRDADPVNPEPAKPTIRLLPLVKDAATGNGAGRASSVAVK